MALEQAWSILKDAAENLTQDERNAKIAEMERQLERLKAYEAKCSDFKDKFGHKPHSKREILDLMVQHGALAGRMPHEIGSPEWSQNMDDLEATGVFNSLDHHYESNAGAQQGNRGAPGWFGEHSAAHVASLNETEYDPENPTPGQQSFIDRARQAKIDFERNEAARDNE